MENNFERIPRETSNRSYFGSDYGRTGTIIAKRGTKILFWTPGHTSWAGIGTQTYASGSLHGINLADRWARLEFKAKGNYDPGNTLRKSLRENDDKIKVFLEIDFSIADVYKQGTTIDLGGLPDSQS